ncbi:MAG: nickel ABC transporter substrate-binding protein [Deltaproteobacteria bacterium]|jgi:nickel transport system substrate-binding protein|nr:nickel ABC transporter substrate-binding protein [Deltaproteobacteria bacterium]
MPAKLILVFLFAAAVLLSVPVSADPGTLVYSFPVSAGKTNPHLYLPNQFYSQMMLYDRLVGYSNEGKIVPELAESWEVSDDGLVYTFHLRPNVKFSDGTPFDAEAVVKNFDTILAKRELHSWQEITNKIEKWEAEGPLTFKLTLNSPYAITLYDLAAFRPYRFLSPAAFPDSGLTYEGIKAPIGTGPWKLVESVPSEYDLYERNDLYWGKKPTIEKVLVKIIPDPLTRAVAMETGQIDLIHGDGQVAYDAFDSFSRDSRYITSISKPVMTETIAVNTGRYPTDDKSVRLALQYVIDRDELVKGLFLNHQVPAYFYCLPSLPYCDISLTPYPFDLELAAKTLDEGGWKLPEGATVREKDGKKLEIPFSFSGTDASEKALAEGFQAQAAKAGIAIILRPEEPDTFLTHNREGNFNLVTLKTWGPPLEPLSYMSGMRDPAIVDFHVQSGLKNKAEIDQKITRMLSAVDEKEKADIVRDIYQTLHNEAVYVPVHGISLMEVHRKGELEGVGFTPNRYQIPFDLIRKLK